MTSRTPTDCIESFPDEILIEIFSYLSANDLKRVMMTSHVFSETVGQSTRLMRKFLLKISPKKKWDFPSLVNLERKHQNVKLLSLNSDQNPMDQIIQGIATIGVHVKQVELSDCVLSIEDLSTIFDKLRNVKKIELLNVKLSELSTQKLAELSRRPSFLQKIPKFSNLTHLEVVKSDCFFEFFLRARNVKDVSLELGDQKIVDLKSFEQFLMNQPKLKALELVDIRFSNFLECDLNFPFQLTSLTINYCHIKVKDHLENFIKRQKSIDRFDLTVDSMKLKLDRIHYFEDSIGIVLAMNNLREVSLDIENYNFSNLKFLNQTANSVRKLKLSAILTTCSVHSILKSFPMVNSLEISAKEMGDQDISYINDNLTQLQELKISKRFPSEAFGRLKLKNLSSLHMNETNIELEHWKVFLGNNSSIKKLIINFNFFVDLSEDLIEVITKALKLDHLELIDKWIGMRNDIYVMICENCKTLRYLKLWNINVEKDFDDEDKSYLRERNVKFHVFNDESLNAPMVPF